MKQLRPAAATALLVCALIIAFLIGRASSPEAENASAPIAVQADQDSTPPTTLVAIETVSDLPTVTFDELPYEAMETVADIDAGGPYEFRKDDSIFQNREGFLPDRPDDHYREYTVVTPGHDDRGARRIVAGADGEMYYTDDHYQSFREIVR